VRLVKNQNGFNAVVYTRQRTQTERPTAMIFHGFIIVRNEIQSFHIPLLVLHDFNLIYEELNSLEARPCEGAVGTHAIGMPSVAQFTTLTIASGHCV
jgi:hypothetical protein